jgi:cobaltochelatase CobS
MSTHTETLDTSAAPDMQVDAATVFGIKTKMKVPAFSRANEHVPEIDPAYRFDRDTTLAILAGFASTAASWFRAITAPANPPISNRWRRG